MPLYLTEYGYFASGHRALPAKKRAKYLPQAYSIALKNPRVKSFLQYLLVAPPKRFEFAFFNTALVTSKNKTYPQYRSLKRWYSKNRGEGQAAGQRADLGARRPARPIARWAARAEPLEKPGAGGWPALGSTSSPTSTRGWRRSRPPRSRAGWTWCSCATSRRARTSCAGRRRCCAALCDEHGALLWLNDRPDLALAFGADGVHVGQDDEPVEAVRAEVGPELLVGLSTHSPEQLEQALGVEADQLSVGPVWETPTKEGRPAAGLDYVRHAATRAAGRALVRDRRHRHG